MLMIGKPTKLRGQQSELQELFPVLFPEYKLNLYYDVLKEAIFCNMHYFDPSYEDEIIRFADSHLIRFQWIIDKALEEHNMIANFSKNTVYDCLVYFAYQTERNLRREWLETLEWDGVPRVRTYFQDMIGAKIPKFSKEDNDFYIGEVTTAWAMGSIARQYGMAQTDVVPLLLGDQRIGKSNCIRFLTAIQEHYIDTTSDMIDPKTFLESINGRVIVELSEATALRSKESERTKSFISKQEDTYRKPYDKVPSTSYRKWVLIATSNLRTPLTDITGNMRYYPIYCTDNPTNKIKRYFEDKDFAFEDASQFWAEAMYMYHTLGLRQHPSEELKRLAEQVQDCASSHNEAIDYLNDYLDNDGTFSKAGAFISRTEIREIMENSDVNITYKGRNNFFYLWYNTKGCEWDEARPEITDTLGGTKRPRGYIRKSDAQPKYGL